MVHDGGLGRWSHGHGGRLVVGGVGVGCGQCHWVVVDVEVGSGGRGHVLVHAVGEGGHGGGVAGRKGEHAGL